jgi:hypothetical protein
MKFWRSKTDPISRKTVMGQTMSNLLYAFVLAFGTFFIAVLTFALFAERNNKIRKWKT